jgi:hypothetical protein
MRVLVTNVTQYAGPGTIPVLLRDGCDVLCHDGSFTDPAARSVTPIGTPAPCAWTRRRLKRSTRR